MTSPTRDDQLPEHLRRVHMVGIGGAGMSGLARILLARGAQVSGSDAKDGRGVLALRTRGARISIGHDPSALDLLEGGPSVVVTTHAAIPKTNPELVEAHRRGIPVILRPQVLADLMSPYRTTLIAGTHGKTSTTSMTVVALQHCGLDPSFAVGGELNESGTNAHHGSGAVFVAEADESDGSLLAYRPDVIVVTNVEADHLDHFGTVAAYVAVFDAFVDRLGAGGALVVCLDDEGSVELARRNSDRLIARGVRVIGYGRGVLADRVPSVDHAVVLDDFRAHGSGGRAEITVRGLEAGADAAREHRYTVTVGVPGIHMTLNALGAIAAAVCSGAPLDDVVAGIETFTGVHRRFQLRGRVGSIAVYDDYAHHPTEVAAVVTAARELATETTGGRVVAVFQPHLYSRTATFAEEFAAALDGADEVVVLDVYGAREEPLDGVTGRTIADRVRASVHYVADISEVAGVVADLAAPGDVVLTLGAGDITMQGPEIVAALTARTQGPGAVQGSEAVPGSDAQQGEHA
ncbi:UDP-N-acetylmuramate--L-alanine ligase [Williamsia deligens]|uniref:UDP-N-acetylmuramate--L-alanine ligase n=1 Tax=Williamsia deligens TaxID=321325 RepID=A0ABW3GAA0_9NOCA|nr:UDP-N-acetylmuramate--L-alanine ligase [Williamsia deligens]MCP2195871.1 UDP-N-acetylmuramate--L-alanine ligase [Williamsia deligens]